MSDRRRRWICQFVFAAVCVLPTAWVVLRIAYRPSPEFYAQQLQLQMGVPVIVGGVSTPTPNYTWLQEVRIQHPETGCWAQADRITLFHGGSDSTRPRWQIEQLIVRESALSDFFAQLHHHIIRQRLHSSSLLKTRGDEVFPLVHIRCVAVMPGEIGLAGTGEAWQHPVVQLKDVVFDWRTGPNNPVPRLEIAAKLVPPRRESDVLTIDSVQPEVPVICTFERQSIDGVSTPSSEFVTRWEVAILERPVPMAWMNLANWPEVVRARQDLDFSGLIGGQIFSHRWRLSCREAKVRGWNLSDLEHLISNQRSNTQAPVSLNIHEVAWSGVHGGPPEWDTCDVELTAGAGQMNARWVKAASWALGLNDEQGSVRHASFEDASNDPRTILFDQLNFGVRWHEGRWWFRPISSPSDQNPLPVLRGYDRQEQILWPGRDERVWNDPNVNHETARVDFSEPANSVEPNTRKSLEIAPVPFSWQPTEFIQGIPDSVYFGQGMEENISEVPSRDRWRIRQLLEHPNSD